MYPSKKLQKQSVYIPKCDVLNAILEERAEDIPIEFDSTDIIDENICKYWRVISNYFKSSVIKNSLIIKCVYNILLNLLFCFFNFVFL